MTTMYVDHGDPRILDVNILPCKCGGEIKFSLAYGRTPYCFYCRSCHNNYDNNITNCHSEKAVEYFNAYISGQEQPFTFKIFNIKDYKGGGVYE